MARVAFEDAIAELDNVAGDSYKDPTTNRKRRVSDLSLVQMTARQVEHESISRVVLAHQNMWFALLLVLSHRQWLGSPATESSTVSNHNIHSIRRLAFLLFAV